MFYTVDFSGYAPLWRRVARQVSLPSSVPRHLLLALAPALLAIGGCASTTTSQLTPSPQKPICQSSIRALILWTPQWRQDQKDVVAREAAAAEGLSQFFEKSGCFKSTSLRRLPENAKALIQHAVTEAKTRNEKVVVVAVRELGPTVKIGSSLALVEGGTEVVLDLSEYEPTTPGPRTFTVQWQSGGPGILKGVATLPQDMQAALTVGFQPPTR